MSEKPSTNWLTKLVALIQSAWRRCKTPTQNIVLSFIEACIVIAVTQLPLLIGIIVYVMRTADAEFTWATARSVFSDTYTHGDVLSYVAGILGSSMAYFLVNMWVLRNRPGLFVPLILLPVLLLLLAAPVYIQDIDGQVGNENFVANYIKYLLWAAVGLWLYSLYQSRVAFNLTLSDKSGAEQIVNEIEGRA